jgi:hypothetical protein
MRPIAVNPTLAQLKDELKVNFSREPSYLGEQQFNSSQGIVNAKTARIEIWLENPRINLKTRVQFYLADTDRLSTTDSQSVEYINNFGVTCWGPQDSLPDYSWFKPNGCRRAMPGEEQLMRFLLAFMNPPRDRELSIENPKAIFAGDFSEIADVVKDYKDTNTVWCMLTATQGRDDPSRWFQTVYPRYFARWNNESKARWSRFINKSEHNKPRGQWSLQLQEFVPPVDSSAVRPDEEPGLAPESSQFF